MNIKRISISVSAVATLIAALSANDVTTAWATISVASATISFLKV